MIHYPSLSPIKQKQKAINAFKGYNHNLRIGDGEFYDDMNVVSDDYPVLSVRKKRDSYRHNAEPLIGRYYPTQGITVYEDTLLQLYVHKPLLNDHLYLSYDYTQSLARMDLGETSYDETVYRQVIKFGSYILIFPDRIWVNLATDGDLFHHFDHGNIDRIVYFNPSDENPVTYALCDIEGNEYTNIETELPENPENGDLWIDTSSTPHVLKKYSLSAEIWETISTYVKITAEGLNAFEKGDSVHLMAGPLPEAYYPIWATGIDGDNPYIVVTEIIDEPATQTDGYFQADVKMPNLDYMTVAGNRLWGCRYGQGRSEINEIQASKLGDFRNWNYYAGTSVDSYTVSLGQDEEFTGAITLNDKPVFFREHCIHTIYGDYPSNYTLETVTGTGVQTGCNKTLATHNGYAYYLSKDGIYVFNGSYPAKLYDAFGRDKFTAPACGVFSYNKYYLTCTKDGQPYMFVHDTGTGILHRENMPQVEQMVVVDDDIFYLTGNDVYSTRYRENSTEDVEWYAESGMIDLYMAEKKYVSQIHIRMALAPQSTCRIRVQYDSSREWERVAELIGTKLTSFTIPLRMKRADHVRIRLEGTGEAHIYSLTKTFSAGSDTA